MRVDYNVPIKHGVVTGMLHCLSSSIIVCHSIFTPLRFVCIIIDTARIDTTLETLNYLLARKGALGGVKCIVLIAHLGQPTGNYNREDFTLFPAVAVLKKALGRDVTFLPDCVGPSIEHAVRRYIHNRHLITSMHHIHMYCSIDDRPTTVHQVQYSYAKTCVSTLKKLVQVKIPRARKSRHPRKPSTHSKNN